EGDAVVGHVRCGGVGGEEADQQPRGGVVPPGSVGVDARDEAETEEDGGRAGEEGAPAGGMGGAADDEGEAREREEEPGGDAGPPDERVPEHGGSVPRGGP